MPDPLIKVVVRCGSPKNPWEYESSIYAHIKTPVYVPALKDLLASCEYEVGLGAVEIFGEEVVKEAYNGEHITLDVPASKLFGSNWGDDYRIQEVK